MTNSQKLNLRLSEIRQRLNTINGLEGDGFTAELRSESETLQTEFSETEVRLRNSLIVESDEAEKRKALEPNSEDRELRQLLNGSSVGSIFSAAMESRKTEGQTAELQQHFDLPSNKIPLEMLRINRGVEERAAATVPDNIGDASQAPVVTPIFATGDGDFLGIERPVVPVGDAAYPVLSTVPSVKGPFSDSSEAAQTDATFVANSLAPERLQASFSYLRSDAARFAGLDASLRLALNSGLQEALDDQAIRERMACSRLKTWTITTPQPLPPFSSICPAYSTDVFDGRYARTRATFG